MRFRIYLAIVFMTFLFVAVGSGVLSAQANPAQPAHGPAADAGLIANAASALPKAMRANATVVAFDRKGAMRTVRKGTGEFTCFPDDPDAPGNSPYEHPMVPVGSLTR